MTYSIVVREPATGALGLAMCSNSVFLAAKSFHRSTQDDPLALVSSQSFSSPALGAAALNDLRAGVAPDRAGRSSLEADQLGPLRQLLVATANGVAAWTGELCVPAAADIRNSAETIAAAGNMLADAAVVTAAVDAVSAADGPLCDRLIAGLRAGHARGGDVRGDRSALVVVVEPGRSVDLCLTVDHHHDPIGELDRLATIAKADAIVRRAVDWFITRPGDAAPRGLADELRSVNDVLGRGADVWADVLDGADGGAASVVDLWHRRDRLVAAISTPDREATS